MNKPSTRLVLIRHAESKPSKDLPEADWPLSSLGQKQAETLAIQLAHSDIANVVSSPYVRAIQSIRPLTENIGVPVEIDHELRERKLCDGLRDDWSELLKNAWLNFDFALPGCESSRDCQNRICNCLLSIVDRFRGKTIAVSSHGNAIGLFLNSIDPSFGFEEWKSMKNPDVFWILYQNGRPKWENKKSVNHTEYSGDNL